MKKLFILPLVMLALATMFSACDDANDDINYLKAHFTSDDAAIAPLVISVKVLDMNGHSVLNNSLTRYISATYQGQTYYCDKPARSFTPNFYGLKHMNDFLIFGELDATKTYNNEKIILSWDSFAAPDTIVFSHTMSMKDGSPQVYESFQLNGKDIEGQMILYKSFTSKKLYTGDIDIPVTAQQRKQIQTLNTFGLQLFQQMMASSENKQGSTLASPIGVAYLLGMIADGAPLYSSTCQEILKVLGFNDSSNTDTLSDMDKLFKLLIEDLDMVDPISRITMASSFFCQKDYPFYAGYAELLANIYHADYSLVDFTSPEAVQTINAWSEQKTFGMIPQILDHVDPQAVAYFLNSVFFTGYWITDFLEENIQQEDFTCKDGTKKKVDMMHQNLNMSYDENDTFTAVTSPLSAYGSFRMTYLLPKEGKTVEDVIQSLVNEPDMKFHFSDQIVSLSLPCFHMESNHEKLIDNLQSFGIKTAFSSSANLNYVWPQSDLPVSSLIQKASIKVNRYGFTAAGGSGASDKANAGFETVTVSFDHRNDNLYNNWENKIPFTCNRPFVFLIREYSTDLNLFIGTYCGD